MDSQWLKLQFQNNPSKSKAALARALCLEPPAISKILSGTRQIKANEYVLMQRFFGLELEKNNANQNKKSYVIEALQNLSEGDAPQGDWSIPASIMGQKTNAPPEKIKIFLIEESIMEPDLKKGEHVLVDMTDKNPSKPGIFLMYDGFGYMSRHCSCKTKSSMRDILISATQDDFEPQTLKYSEITIIGRVIGKIGWL